MAIHKRLHNLGVWWSKMAEDKITFSFGKNWEKFVKHYFSEKRVLISKEHILNFLEMSDLKGKYFLDVGCGSGLSSLAAFKAGAEGKTRSSLSTSINKSEGCHIWLMLGIC